MVARDEPEFLISLVPPRRQAWDEYIPPRSKPIAVIVAFSWRLKVLAVRPGNRGSPALTRSDIHGHTLWTGHRSFAVFDAAPQRQGLIRMHPLRIFFRKANFITSTVVSLYLRVPMSAFSVWGINSVIRSSRKARTRRRVSDGTLSPKRYDR